MFLENVCVQEYFNTAVFYEMASYKAVIVTGKDRLRFLNGMLTNEVLAKSNGEGANHFLLNNQGKWIASLMLLHFESHVLILTESFNLQNLLTSLDKYVIADKVNFDIAENLSFYAIQGVLAEKYFSNWQDGDIFPITNCSHRPFFFSGKSFSEKAFAVRADLWGYKGSILCIPSEEKDRLESNLTKNQFMSINENDVEELRIFFSIPRDGKEFQNTTIPLEAGKWVEDNFINHKKGCYIGQETICRIKARGHVNWMLTSFELDNYVENGTLIYNGDKKIGWITSSIKSSLSSDSPDCSGSDSRIIGLGYMHRQFRNIGDILEISSISNNTTLPKTTVKIKALRTGEFI